METKRENIAVPISVAGVIVIVFRFILSILSRTLLVPLAVNLEGFGIALYTIILNVLVFLVVLGSIMIANRVANKKTNIGVVIVASIAVVFVDFILSRLMGLFLGISYLYLFRIAILTGIGEFCVLKFSQEKLVNIPAQQSVNMSIQQPVIQSVNNQTNNTTIKGEGKMHCRNCGSEMNENAVVCVKCGVAKGSGDAYCPNCGKETNPNAAVCLNCGYALANTNIVAGENAKSKLVAGLLGIFLGGWGIHNFYLGYTKKAVIQVLLGTVGIILFIGPVISGIWGLVEGIMILTGGIKVDGNGNPLKN